MGPACLDKIKGKNRTNKQRTRGTPLLETPLLSVEELWVLQVPWPGFLLPPFRSEITTVKEKTHNINFLSILKIHLISFTTLECASSIRNRITAYFQVFKVQRSSYLTSFSCLNFVTRSLNCENSEMGESLATLQNSPSKFQCLELHFFI